MNQNCARSVCALSAFALALGFATTAHAAQNHERQIRESINESNRVTLAGNTHPDAIPANDRGILRDEAPMDGLQLVLHRSPEAEAAFQQYISELHNPKSAFFHKWLTNKQIGDRFGASDEDLNTVKEWLSSKGLHIGTVSPDRMSIEFSGDAGHVREAFQAPVHRLMVDGKMHFSNVNDPSMPRALVPVVEGVAKLNDFMPHGMATRRPDVEPKGGQGSVGDPPFNFIGAADLATVYNFNPVFAAGITGKGQTIVLIENTNQFSASDFLAFRKVMGLSRTYPFGTLTQVNPAGSANACGNPGDNGDDTEAALDVDWATAAAPNASIVSAACADTAQFGGFLALANLLTEANPPKIVSISYGESETQLGAAENLYIKNLYQSAVGEGVTIFVSSGDEGADSSDANRANATRGISVSGFTSTPYNVSVGGTDFAAFPFGEYNTYFSATNLANFRTALSYIPEIPWDDSCAGAIYSEFNGFPTYGPGSICNQFSGVQTTGAGSGGPSGCATGATARGKNGVVSGSCAGYAKPAWQSLVGVPSDNVRDIPDVSLMASNGFWGEYYAACISNPADGTAAEGFTPCGPNPANWTGWGGTSISSPIWAGIQALVNQSTGEAWGNANPVLYSLANTEYGPSGNSSCNASLGNAIGSGCLFNDVTAGDIVINCTGANNCYINGGTYGILSTSDSAPDGAYPATTGWDFATGIGTANVANLVNGWHAIAATTKPILLDKMKK